MNRQAPAPRRLLLASNGSDACIRAAAALRVLELARVTVVTVAPSAPEDSPAVVSDVVPRAAVEEGRAGVHLRWAGEVMAATVEALGGAEEQTVVAGDAAAEICRLAADGYDAIVLGSSGPAGLRRVASHSVADEVLASAPCPVLVLGHDAPG